MKRRHALLLGFGLGALALMGVTAVGESSGLFLKSSPAGGSTQVSPSPSPSPSHGPAGVPGLPGPRIGAAMVYDPENKGLILFGGAHTVQTADGHNLSVSTDDTWLWDGSSWRRLDVAGPPARSAAYAVYDTARRELVLFGGGNETVNLLQDTWTWDGGHWTEMHPAHSPAGRIGAGMAFDVRRGVTVLFGGQGQIDYRDTWTWDGQDWTLQNPVTVPSDRHFTSMAYDAVHEQTVLFGGSLPGIRLNDTWTWDGTNWTEHPSARPEASGFAYLTYDAGRGQVVGYVYYALDGHPVAEYTITWDGTRWNDRTTSADPSPRANPAIAYDAATHQVVLYGGTFDQPQPFGETWVWDGSKWSLWQAQAGA